MDLALPEERRKVLSHIFDYIHSDMKYLFIKGDNQPPKQLPISMLIELGSLNTYYLESYKDLLLNGKFQLNLGFLFSKYGNRDSLQWLISKKKYPWDNRVLNNFAKRGDFDSLLLAQANGCLWGTKPYDGSRLLSFLGKYNYISVRWMIKKDFLTEFGESTAVVLARCGSILDINEAVRLRCPIDCRTITLMLAEAAKRGRLDILQWIINFVRTVKLNSLAQFDYLKSHRRIWEAAFEDPQLVFVNWFKTYDPSDGNSETFSCCNHFFRPKLYGSYEVFIRKGDLQLLLLAISKRPEFFFLDLRKDFTSLLRTRCWELLLRKLAEYGKLDLAQGIYQLYGQYLKSMMSEEICSIVASTGHLAFLMWLREEERKCPWNKATYEKAACNGHIEIICWAYDNGCPTTSADTTFEMSCSNLSEKQQLFEHLALCAARGGQLHVLKWLHSETPLSSSNLKEVSLEAGCGGVSSIEIVKWIYEEVDSSSTFW